MVDTRPTVDPSWLFSGPDAPEESDLYKCVHCGFCLQVCPTYLETGLETESPRGRIALMKAVNEGRIGMTDSVVRHWDLCIQCRACEVACPSGVPYGSLIEATMAQVERKRKVGFLPRLASGLALNHIIPNQGVLEFTVAMARVYQRTGVQSLVRKSGLLKLVSKSLADMESSMPAASNSFFRAQGQTISPEGDVRARVALLSGCVMPLFSGNEMDAVVRVLTEMDVRLWCPKARPAAGPYTHTSETLRPPGPWQNATSTSSTMPVLTLSSSPQPAAGLA